jgi:molybdenum cofactor cytidylyltransferase
VSVGLIILAAGGSSRLGSPKQLVQFSGESLLRRAARTALASNLRPIVVVLAEAKFASEIEGLDFVLNPDWRTGMGSSIRAGIAGMQANGVVILLCDQPLITPDFLNRLASTKKPLAAAEYNGTIGVPAFFSARYFEELKQLEGGAKEILLRHRDDVEALPCPEAALDIDTAADVARLAQQQQSQQ